MADVFAFRGRAYYGKPGWEFRPTEVQEDFSEWRQTKSQNGKAVADWLIKNGFRMVYRSFSRGAEAREYKEWWAKVEFVGEQGQVLPNELKQQIAATISISVEVDGDEAVKAAMGKLPPWEDGKEDRWGCCEWACGCAYHPPIASSKEETIVLCRTHR